MKIIAVIALIAAIGLSLPGMAAQDQKGHVGHGHGHGNLSEKPGSDVSLTEGVVKKIDKPAGKVTVSHGPLPNGMPAMTMMFRVKELAWLEQMKEGGRILFRADQVNGIMTIIRFKEVQ